MGKKLLIMVVVLFLFTSQAFAGLLFTYIKSPVCATGSDALPVKTGYASNFMLFGMVTLGDGSIKTAAESAGIKEVVYVDSSFMMLPFGIIAVQTTEVSGK